MKRTIISAAALALVASSAAAATPSFYAVDANNDNKVSWDELSTAFPSVSLFDFSAMDLNGDRSISASEMENNIDALDLDRQATVNVEPTTEVPTRTTMVETPFTRMDTDDNMKVSWEELSYAVPKASLFDFTEVDQNGDGALSEEELANRSEYLEQDNMNDNFEAGDASVVTQPETDTKQGG